MAARLLLDEAETGAGKEERDGEGGLARLHKPLLQLKIRQLEERAAGLQADIRSAEAAGDLEKGANLLQEKQALSGEIRDLKQELRRPTAGLSG